MIYWSVVVYICIWLRVKIFVFVYFLRKNKVDDKKFKEDKR